MCRVVRARGSCVQARAFLGQATHKYKYVWVENGVEPLSCETMSAQLYGSDFRESHVQRAGDLDGRYQEIVLMPQISAQ